MTLRIGLLGAGGMASARGDALVAMDGVAVTAVHSRRSERAAALAARFGASAYADLPACLEAVDAVVVAVPNAHHEALVAAALEAGRHVLVEYPLATSSEAAERLRRLAAERDLVLMVGNTIVHEAMFHYLTGRLDRLGNLLSAASRAAFFSPELADGWYLQPALTGPVFVAYHYHHIEYYRHLLGEPEWVFARLEARPGSDPERLSTNGGTLLTGHAGGTTSCVQWYLGGQGDAFPRGLWLTGDRGSVTVVSHRKGHSQVTWGGGGPGQVEELEDDWGVAGSTAAFIAALRGEVDHRAALASDLRTLAVALAAARSAEERRPVSL